MATIRAYVPVDVEIDDQHLQEVLSAEWGSVFYDFDSDRQVAAYVARLMLAGQRIPTNSLGGFDGHYMPNRETELATLTLADMDDDAWSLAALCEFAEELSDE